MAVLNATMRELADVVSGSEPVTFVAGAACSRPLPTDIPDAATWKRVLIEPLVSIADCGLPADAVERLAQAHGVQLEAIFLALGHQSPGLGERLVELIEPDGTGKGDPNDLHELLAARALRVPGTTIFTTNFDQCFERAFAKLGASPDRWLPSDASPGANTTVFKLHGSTEHPASLRHTFDAVGRAFTPEARRALRPQCAHKLVLLGYFGADPDVLDLLGAGDAAWWLARSGDLATPRQGAARLGLVRDVRVATGVFDDLLVALARPGLAMGDGRRLTGPTAAHMRSSLDRALARAALAELTFRALTASAAMRGLDDVVARSVRIDGALRGDQVWRVRGTRARYRGGLLLHPVQSAVAFLGAAMAASGPSRLEYVSDALDAVEMIGLGLVTPLRAALLPFYALIRRRLETRWKQTSGAAVAMACFRVGRSALSASLDRREGNMFLGGIAHRWRAQARARRKDAMWRDDVAAARELLVFEDRQQELADLLRTEGSCLLIADGDAVGARRLISLSRVSHLRRGERRGVRRCEFALRLLVLGPLGRRLMRLLVL